MELTTGTVEAPSWAKYPSINDVDLQQVEKIRHAVHGTDIEFVALEKVHGSNFAFETDGGAVSYYSRNRRLDAQERFVGKTAPAAAMSRYHNAVAAAFWICRSEVSRGAASVVIYGEYFGGWFPNSSDKHEGAGIGTPVQKGIVAYAPAHHFFAFDICIDGLFLDFDEGRSILERAGFPLVATPVVRGSFDECMSFDVESFCTAVPEQLGLPLCAEYAIAEGVVIRPVKHHLAWTVKKKSVRYLEACPDELRKWLAKCVDSKEEALAGLYLALCQKPRLDAVLSKDPQLRSSRHTALPRVQDLFRWDVEDALHKRLVTIKVTVPQNVCLDDARAEADRRVREWLLETEV